MKSFSVSYVRAFLRLSNHRLSPPTNLKPYLFCISHDPPKSKDDKLTTQPAPTNRARAYDVTWPIVGSQSSWPGDSRPDAGLGQLGERSSRPKPVPPRR